MVFFYLGLINEDIGLQYGKYSTLSDASLATSSNQFDKDDANPRDGRLYKPLKFWCPADRYEPSYLEFILVEKYYIFAVSVQGQPLQSGDDFASEFTIAYSTNYRKWKEFNAKYKVGSYLYLMQFITTPLVVNILP